MITPSLSFARVTPRAFCVVAAGALSGCGLFGGLFDAGSGDAAGLDASAVDVWTLTRDVAEDTLGNVDQTFGQMTSTVTMGNDGRHFADGAVDSAAMQFGIGATAIDLNGDGVTEWLVTRDGLGNAIRETIDTNGDGHPDLVWDRTGTTHFFLADHDFDGHFEYRRETTPSPIAPGAIAYLITEDTNGDYASDRRVSYVANPQEDSMVLLFEYWDTQLQDWGRDLVGTSTVPRLQGQAVTTPASGTGMCNPMQLMMLQSAVAAARAQGIGCLASADPAAGEQAAHDMTSPVEVDCEPIPTQNGGSLCALASNTDDWHNNGGTMVIRVRPDVANGTAMGCGSVEGTMFHEMMHFVTGSHEYGNNGRSGVDDLGDQVFGCERFCFPPSSDDTNRFTCAQCLGTTVHDARCAPFPDIIPCDATVTQRACTCSGQLFNGGTASHDCSAACTGCFDPTCIPRGPCR